MSEVEEAVAQCERILETIDDLPESSKDKGQEFFEGIITSVKGINTTIEKTQRVSTKQQNALDNMERGVNKWVH